MLYGPYYGCSISQGYRGICYFIGNNTSLKEIIFLTNDINDPEALCRGINNNFLLEQIGFTHGITTLEGNVFGMLDQFFTNNRI